MLINIVATHSTILTDSSNFKQCEHWIATMSLLQTVNEGRKVFFSPSFKSVLELLWIPCVAFSMCNNYTFHRMSNLTLNIVITCFRLHIIFRTCATSFLFMFWKRLSYCIPLCYFPKLQTNESLYVMGSLHIILRYTKQVFVSQVSDIDILNGAKEVPHTAEYPHHGVLDYV